MRTGEGNKSRFRGAMSYATDNPQLAAFDTLIAAMEFEADPVTQTIKGAVYEWK